MGWFFRWIGPNEFARIDALATIDAAFGGRVARRRDDRHAFGSVSVASELLMAAGDSSTT